MKKQKSWYETQAKCICREMYTCNHRKSPGNRCIERSCPKRKKETK